MSNISVRVEETISPLVVAEQVKCLFRNSQTEQKCIAASEGYSGYGCSGTASCLADIKGKQGEKITWKSSCGGYAYTTMDGQGEYAGFDCAAVPVPISPATSSTAETPVRLCAKLACATGYTAYDTGEKNSDGCPVQKCLPVAPITTTPVTTITVLNPNGGEIWQKGTTQTIKWNSSNVSKLYIKLRKGNDTYPGAEGVVSEVIPNNGFLQWTVPATLPEGNDYAIRVVDSASGLLDDSDSFFSIKEATDTSTEKTCSDLQVSQRYYFNQCSDSGFENVCLNKFSGVYQGCTRNTWNDCTQSNANAEVNLLCSVGPVSHSITVLYPNGGEVWQIGQVQTIKWDGSSYSANGVMRIVLIDEKTGAETPIYNAYNTSTHNVGVSASYQPGSNYKIKIITPDEKYDLSDAPFSIVSAATGLIDIENQLADISRASAGIIGEIQKLLKNK